MNKTVTNKQIEELHSASHSWVKSTNEGKEKDKETGFNFFDLRMYDARIGRTISPDPYGQFASPYMWVGNNPVSGTDPTGGLANILLNTVVVVKTASRLPSLAQTFATSALRGLASSALTSAFNPLDEDHFNSSTQKTTVVKTDKNYD